MDLRFHRRYRKTGTLVYVRHLHSSVTFLTVRNRRSPQGTEKPFRDADAYFP
jgi:hypothetical protein